jgi:hypothetical protein
MNWEAIGAIGEIVGAAAVIITLIYLASQVRYAKNATLDQNRLTRSSAIREIILSTANNDSLRVAQMTNWGLESYYDSLAVEFGTDPVEASRNECANAAYFWMYWGQWASSHEKSDIVELEHVMVRLFSLPGVRHTWDLSPLGKVLLDEDFVRFVDEVLERHSVPVYSSKTS